MGTFLTKNKIILLNIIRILLQESANESRRVMSPAHKVPRMRSTRRWL